MHQQRHRSSVHNQGKGLGHHHQIHAMKIITVKQCLEIMDSGKPFYCLVVTYDRQRRKGGRIMEMDAQIEKKGAHDWQLPSREIGTRPEEQPAAAARPMTDYEAKLAALSAPDDTSRNPNHKHWYTRNVRVLVNGHPTDIVKIHPPILWEFNGMQVVP
jgi:hypothetical protein